MNKQEKELMELANKNIDHYKTLCNEMLEALIDAQHYVYSIGDYYEYECDDERSAKKFYLKADKYIKLIEKATNKSWETIKKEREDENKRIS